MKEEKYIIEKKTISDWQKTLNQWRHKYNISVLFSHSEGNQLLLGIKRVEK